MILLDHDYSIHFPVDCRSLGSTDHHCIASVLAGHEEHHSNGEAQPQLSVRERSGRDRSVSSSHVLHRYRGLFDSTPAFQETARKIHDPLEGGILAGNGYEYAGCDFGNQLDPGRITNGGGSSQPDSA